MYFFLLKFKIFLKHCDFRISFCFVRLFVYDVIVLIQSDREICLCSQLVCAQRTRFLPSSACEDTNAHAREKKKEQKYKKIKQKTETKIQI